MIIHVSYSIITHQLTGFGYCDLDLVTAGGHNNFLLTEILRHTAPSAVQYTSATLIQYFYDVAHSSNV